MNTSPIGIKFLLQGGAFLLSVVPEYVAIRIMDDWSAGKYQDKEVISGACLLTNTRWAVMAGSVMGVHTFQPEALQQTTAAQKPFINKSGLA